MEVRMKRWLGFIGWVFLALAAAHGQDSVFPK